MISILQLFMEERNLSFLFSNSLCSNENNLIYIHKQLGNKGKPKFSASRAVFLCNMLRGNKVAIFLSKIYLYLYNLMQLYPTNATYFGNSLWQFSMAILMVVATLAKNLRPLYQNGEIFSDSFDYRKTKSCRQHGLFVLGLTF